MSGKALSTSETRIEALKLQSSAYGVVVPMAYGVTRMPGNIVWYGGFKAVPHTATQGGKGGGVKSQNTTYTYTASVMMGLCMGVITGIPRVWRGKKQFTGGVTPGQVLTVVETYTPPASGPMVYTVTQAASYIGSVWARYTGERDGPGTSVITLVEGEDFTAVAGVMTVLNDALRGQSLSFEYQYTTGAVSNAALDELGLTLIKGALGQAAWSGLATFGVQSIGYSGLACVAGAAYDLGTGAQVENHNFEVVAPFAYHLGAGVPDVDPALVLRDLLTDARGGATFPGGRLDAWAAWSDYCVASGLLVSPALTEQKRAAEIVHMAAELTNTGPVWTGGVLVMVPYGDTAVTGNGRTYTPNNVPVFDLDDECWVSSPPLKCKEKSPADRYNHIRVQYRDRASQYNPAIAEAKDQADIDAYGLRSATVYEAPWLCDAAAARQVAQVLLQRSLYVANTYECTLPWHYALLEPMDLCTLTDIAMGLVLAPVRVLTIAENGDGDLQVSFEDAASVSSAATYPSQGGSGYQADYNAAPGNVDPPSIFEGPAEWSRTGLQVFTAVRGSGAIWGGCQVWLSLDGTRYKQLGVVYGGARYGTLSAAASSVDTSIAVQGLGASQLITGSAADAAALTTLCYIGGTAKEYLAYQTATLTAAGAYTLAGLVRAGYSTAAAAHASGDQFVRVDDRVIRSEDLDVSYIGKTVYFKFTSFNITGGGQQGLADVSPYAYVITGAMAALVPGIGGKSIKLTASSLTFTPAAGITFSPASITLTAVLKGSLNGTTVWTVQAGTLTLAGAGLVRTVDPVSMTTDTATISVSVTDAVATYTDFVTLTKVRNGEQCILITVYAQAVTAPATPSGGSYTFTGDVFVNPTVGVRPLPVTTTVPTWASSAQFCTRTPDIPIPGPAGNAAVLLHFNGANGSAVFTDSGANALSFSPHNGAVLTTTPGKFVFGGAGGDFTASTTTYIDVGPTAALSIPAGPFTVRMRWIPSVAQTSSFWFGLTDGTSHIWFDTNGAGQIECHCLGYQLSSGVLAVAGTDYYLAVARDGAGAMAWWLNGVRAGTFVGVGNTTTLTSPRLQIGATPTLAGGGTGGRCYIDELQILIDTAAHQYTDLTITVPTAEFAGGGWSPFVQYAVNGINAVATRLTNGSVTVSADATGVVASFAGAGGTFELKDGVVDKTGTAAVTYSVFASAGVTIAIASTGVYTVSAMSANTGTATLRAVYLGVNYDEVYSIAKALAAADVDVTMSPASVYLYGSVYTGTVVNFSTATTTAKVRRGGVDETGLWTITATGSTGITASATAGVVTVSAMTVDIGNITVSFVRSGYASVERIVRIEKLRNNPESGIISNSTTVRVAGIYEVGGTAIAGIRITSNGEVQTTVDGSTWLYWYRWYFPTTTGIGSTHSVGCVEAGPQFLTTTPGAGPVSLATTRTYLLQRTAAGVSNSKFALSVYNASGLSPFLVNVELQVRFEPFP